jgi:hypothetical protein
MKKVLISLACLIVLAALYACINTGNEDLKTSDTAAAGVSFERVGPDALSADLSGRIDQSRVEEGYEILTSGDENFIVVYAGQRPTAGYNIEITSVASGEGKTKVLVKETSPAEGDMTAQVLTYPFDVAKLGSPVNGSVEIEYIKDNTD